MADKRFPTNMLLTLNIRISPLVTLGPLGDIPIQMSGFKNVGKDKCVIEFSTQESEIGQMVITAPAEEFHKLAAIIQQFFKPKKGKKKNED